MNNVLSSYGQLCSCPEILKKSCKFFVVGLTYGCRNPCKGISGNDSGFCFFASSVFPHPFVIPPYMALIRLI